MPNIKSAEKRLLQSAKARLRNRTRLIATRNQIKKLLKTTNVDEAQKLLPQCVSMLDKLANRKIIHKNNASNQKSRLTLFVGKLAANKA